MSTKLLMDEHPLIILPNLAMKIGLNEAIFLQQLHYWLQKSKNVINGLSWSYNSYDQLLQQFPFFSLSTLKRTIRKLKDMKIIEVEQLNRDQRNKTNYYTINYEIFDQIKEEKSIKTEQRSMNQCNGSGCTTPIVQNGPMENFKMNQCYYSTETTVETTAEIKKEKRKKQSLKSQIETKLSEYQNINLEAFNEWMEYKNHSHKTIAPITKIINFLVQYPFEIQQEIINTSIMNEYQGLFPPRQQTNNNSTLQLQTLNPNVNVWDEIARAGNNQQGVING